MQNTSSVNTSLCNISVLHQSNYSAEELNNIDVNVQLSSQDSIEATVDFGWSELRIYIWKAFEPELRVICFSLYTANGRARHKIGVHCPTKSPALLYTSQESRNAILSSYKLLMKDRLTYINLSTDLMYFDAWVTYKICLRIDLPLSLPEKTETVNLASLKEVTMQLKHIVIDDVPYQGAGSEFDDYTDMRALRSLAFCEDIIKQLPVHEIPNSQDRGSFVREIRTSLWWWWRELREMKWLVEGGWLWLVFVDD